MLCWVRLLFYVILGDVMLYKVIVLCSVMLVYVRLLFDVMFDVMLGHCFMLCLVMLC